MPAFRNVFAVFLLRALEIRGVHFVPNHSLESFESAGKKEG